MGKDIIALMLQEYDSFTRSERKIADYVLEHQEETQYISITDLSSQCEVAVSTVSLFCRKLKLAGFNDFKLELARAVLPARGAPQEPEGENTSLMARVLATAQDTLNSTYHILSEEAAAQAVELLCRAGQVVCLGQGNHSVVALAAWAQFSTVSPKFKTISDSHMQTVVLSTLSEGDAVLYFSYSGSTRELAENLRLVRQRRGRSVLITRFPKSPGGVYADVVLQCGSTEGPIQGGSVAARVAQLFLLDVLFSEVCRRDLEGCQRRRAEVAEVISNLHL